ncbi:hypothetical protein pb186bvf_019273 [Paramecium bursaria]
MLDTLNQLFKDFFTMSDVKQLDYYKQQEQRLLQKNHQVSSESDIRLLHRFLSRMQEAFSNLMEKKTIQRSKYSNFDNTLNQCFAQIQEGKYNIIPIMIQAVYKECNLQQEIQTRAEPTPKKRVFNLRDFPRFIVQKMMTNPNLLSKAGSPPYQIGRFNKNSINSYKTIMRNSIPSSMMLSKIGIYLFMNRNVDEQPFIYYFSKESNMERLYKELLEQNQHIKKSLSWVNHIDQDKLQQDLKSKQQKLQPIFINDESPTRSRITAKIRLPNKSVIVSPQKKIRSVSQNETPSKSEKFRIHSNTLFLQKQTKEIQLNKISIEFKAKKQVNVLKSKMNNELFLNGKIKNVCYRYGHNYI